MQVGVFIPIGNNGWLISTTSPQYMPTFDLNREVGAFRLHRLETADDAIELHPVLDVPDGRFESRPRAPELFGRQRDSGEVVRLVNDRPQVVVPAEAHPSHAGPTPDDGQLVDIIAEIAPSAAARQALLVENPLRLYRFVRRATGSA